MVTHVTAPILTERQLEYLLAAGPAVLYVLEVEGDALIPTWVSGNLGRILGYETEECIGDSDWWPGSLHPEDQDDVMARIPQLLRTGSLTHDYRFRHKNGTYLWVHDELRVVTDESGQPTEIVGAWSDITEQRSMSDALGELEEFRHDLFDSCGDSILLADRDGVILDCNDGAEKKFGKNRKDLLGKRLFDLMPSGVDKSWLDKLDTLDRGESIYFQDEREGMWFDNHLDPASLKDGKAERIVVVSRDITDRKRAEDKLQESEARFRNLVEGSIAGVLIHRNEEPLFVNEARAEIHGYTRKELLDLESVSLLVAPHERERLLDCDRALLEGSINSSRCEYQALHKDGSVIWLASALQAVSWNGEPAIQVTSIDITEILNAEEALRREQARLDSIMNNAPLAIALKDLEYRYIIVNKHASELIGKPKNEILGKTAYDIFPKQFADVLSEHDHRVVETGSVVEQEVFLPIAHGGLRPYFEVKFPIVERPGTVVGLGVMSFDLEERKKLEEQLAYAQKMEAVGVLAAGVAHEFNNLLQANLSYLELLGRQISRGGDPEGALQGAREAAYAGARITGGLLAFARKQPLRPKVVDLEDIIFKVTGVLPGTRIEVATDVSEDLWPAFADEDKLQSALLNLALNACDAMPEGGKLTVEAANAFIDEERAAGQSKLPPDNEIRPGDYVMIAVSDTGTGIPPKHLEHIFEPFFTTKETGKGTGLGLSMVYGFAKQSKGFLVVDTEVGRGTRVELYLPGRPQIEKPEHAL